MSGFVIRATDDHEAAVHGEEIALAAFAKKGLARTSTLRGRGYVLDLFANTHHDPSQSLFRDQEGASCTYTGTLIYNGLVGVAASAALLEAFRRDSKSWLQSALGTYCIFILDHEQLRVFTDPAGLFHVYHDSSLSLVSSSFIVSASYQKIRTFRQQEMLEYVLLGATFGDLTILQEVFLLPAESVFHVSGETRRLESCGSVWESESRRPSVNSIDQTVSEVLKCADDYYEGLRHGFGGGATAALSGGYDSRLSLGLMQRNGITPSLFVYGSRNDPDVQIAREISEGMGLAVEHSDRARRKPIEPERYWENQESVFHGLDGLTQYGFACAPSEVEHRRKRASRGTVAVNGGGGEIWRDFWKLPDRPLSPESFIAGYYQGRHSGLRDSVFPAKKFYARLAEKVRPLADSATGAMTSETVQSLYARMRLRYWQGKNNSVDNLFGYAVTPFSETRFTVPAARIPMAAKRNGWFERQLILRVSPRLACYRSTHGHRIDRGPSFVVRSQNAVKCGLPFWLRARHRMASASFGRAYYHSERYVEARFGRGKLAIEQLVDLPRLGDGLAFSRALSVERMIRGEWT